MSTIPVPHQWSVGNEVTATDLNSLVTAAQWAITEPPISSLVQTSAQSIPYKTWTTILLDTVVFDSEGGASTAGSAYFAQTAGWYLVSATVNFVAVNNGAEFSRFIRLIANGQPSIQGMGGCLRFGASNMMPYFQTVVYLSVSDYVQLQAWHNEGELATPTSTSTAVSNTAPAREVSSINLMWISA